MGWFLVPERTEPCADHGEQADGIPTCATVYALDATDEDDHVGVHAALELEDDLPEVGGRVVIEGDLDLTGPEVVLYGYRVSPVQVAGKVTYERRTNTIECPGPGVLESAQLGLGDAAELESLAAAINGRRIELLIWDGGWAIPGLAAWKRGWEERAAAKARDRAAAEQRKRLREWQQSDGFINPYNFVPLPQGSGPEREAPRSHEVLDEGVLSGRIEFTLTALTPLAISGPGEPHDRHQPVQPHVIDGAVAIPGSSLAGTVRAFHEALTGSCLRILDPTYVPVHREPAVSHLHDGWRMAIVEEADSTVRLCDPVRVGENDYAAVWVEARWLGTAVGSLESGDPYNFPAADGDLEIPTRRDRPELRTAASTRAPKRRRAGGAKVGEQGALKSGEWTTMVTKRLKSPVTVAGQHPYHLPFARVSDDVVTLPLEVLADYRSVSEGSEDPVTRSKGHLPTLEIQGNKGRVGSRQEKSSALPVGTVVWVDTKEQRDGSRTVTRISRASIWRRRGDYPVRDRVDGYGPCTDPNDLCPSCRLFGMVRERERKATRTGIHEAFRGRVRFGWAMFDGEPEAILTSAEQIGPLGQPRPSSGQFYLDTDPVANGKRARSQTDRPLRDWGSSMDSKDRKRRIRGRKRYWAVATDGARNVGAHNDNEELRVWQKLVKTDSLARGWVTFEGLSRAELGALLASLDPNLLSGVQQAEALSSPDVWGEGDKHPFVHQIGKAKAKGLGAVKVDIEKSRFWSSHRYDHQAPAADVNGAESNEVVEEVPIGSLVSEFAGSVPAQVTDTWPALLAMAQFGRFPTESVKYPPDDRPGANFRFDFWQKSSGGYLSNTEDNMGKGLVVLPDAAAPDPRIRRPWLRRD